MNYNITTGFHLKDSKEAFVVELRENILPFWMRNMPDRKNGGFIGRISGDGVPHADAPKGAILHARILWTFSAAYRIFDDPEYLKTADRAKGYLLTKFWDHKNGGIFWQLAADGTPLDTKKQIYALGFAIYGLSEYARATGDVEALEKAKELYYSIEKYSFDKSKNGYFEAFTDDWKEIEDMRLSDKDANEKKTMNTHLHILEPYANLYRVWPSAELKTSLRNLLQIFLDKILDCETGHLRLFFDEDWTCKSKITSYGHDIEALWLMYEAANVLGDTDLIERVKAVVPLIAEATKEGLQPDGAMVYEKDEATGHVDNDRHWWVQAEAVVGFSYASVITGQQEYGEIAQKCWEFIQEKLVDKEQGEWFWSIKADGSVNRSDDKAGFWKCPYHNGRMCMEMIENINANES
jgi:mannobiose 2-epimerase